MIEADFRQFYGADLRDFWRKGSGMTYRWVASHIQLLPEESRWVRHRRAKEDLVWDQDHYQRQDIVDLLQLVVYYLSAEVTKGLKAPQIQKLHKGAPKPSSRPGTQVEKPKMTPKDELKSFFAKPNRG